MRAGPNPAEWGAELRRRAQALLLCLLLVGAVLVGTAWFALPRLVAAGAQMELARVLGPQSRVALQIAPDHPLRLLAGHVAGLHLVAEEGRISGLGVRRLELRADELDVDVGALLFGRRLAVTASRGVAARMEIDEQALNDYLARRLPSGQGFRIALGAGGATLTAQPEYAGRRFRLQARGRFLASGGRVALAVDQLTVDGIAAPAGLRDQLLALLGAGALSLDLSGLPVPLRIDAVTASPGLLSVEATGP